MPSLNAFKKLDAETRKAIITRILTRKHRFLELTTWKFDPVFCDVLLVGDRPAPSAPDDPEFHYTPFGALWNSSLYINLELHGAGIYESKLSWLNAADFHGNQTSFEFLDLPWKRVIALGGAGSRWLKSSGKNLAHETVHHPAAWKRFHAREPYPLIDMLR